MLTSEEIRSVVLGLHISVFLVCTKNMFMAN